MSMPIPNGLIHAGSLSAAAHPAPWAPTARGADPPSRRRGSPELELSHGSSSRGHSGPNGHWLIESPTRPRPAPLAPAGSRPQRSLRLRPRHADLDRAPDLRRAPDPTRRGGLRLGRGEPLRLRRRLLRFRRVFRRAVRRLPRQYPKSRPFKKGGTRAGTSARWKRFIQAPNTR